MKKTTNQARLKLSRLTVTPLRRATGGRPETGWWNPDKSYDPGCSGSCNTCDHCGSWEFEY